MLSVRVMEYNKLTKQKQIKEKSHKINNEGWGKCRLDHEIFANSKSKLNTMM